MTSDISSAQSICSAVDANGVVTCNGVANRPDPTSVTYYDTTKPSAPNTLNFLGNGYTFGYVSINSGSTLPQFDVNVENFNGGDTQSRTGFSVYTTNLSNHVTFKNVSIFEQGIANATPAAKAVNINNQSAVRATVAFDMDSASNVSSDLNAGNAISVSLRAGGTVTANLSGQIRADNIRSDGFNLNFYGYSPPAANERNQALVTLTTTGKINAGQNGIYVTTLNSWAMDTHIVVDGEITGKINGVIGNLSTGVGVQPAILTSGNTTRIDVNGRIYDIRLGVGVGGASAFNGDRTLINIAQQARITASMMAISISYQFGTDNRWSINNSGLLEVTQSDATTISAGGTGTLFNAGSGIIKNSSGDAVRFNGALPNEITNLGRIEGNIRGGEGQETFNLLGGSIEGNVYLNGDNDTFSWYAGAFRGNLNMGTGSDRVLINAAEFDGSNIFNGGSKLVNDFDEIELQDINQTMRADHLLNWDHIIINDSHLNFANGGGDLTVGLLDINEDGVVVFPTMSVVGNIANTGRLSFEDNSAFSTLTVQGSYSGNSGTIIFSTQLGDDTSPTDFLHITGNATGTTGVQVVNRGGLGALTSGDGIQLIKVDGSSSADNFSLKSDYSFEGQAAVVGGAYAYSLYAGNKAGDFAGDWYLRSLT
ncbi:autotransporter outer membrane beta-barrel domain-containing protein, partial [Bartonella sp. LJL80]